jgi:hypothetical protein
MSQRGHFPLEGGDRSNIFDGGGHVRQRIGEAALNTGGERDVVVGDPDTSSGEGGGPA